MNSANSKNPIALRFIFLLLAAHCLLITAVAQSAGQAQVLPLRESAQSIPAPKDVLGFTPGDDRKLASWAQIVEYFKKLDAASDRVMFREIGKTTEGRPFVYAVFSSPENLSKLDEYLEINDKLADPRKIKRDDAEAKKQIEKGKAFVVITHGIHSTEVGSTLSSTLTAHRLATSNEADIRKILDETFVVMVPSLNPDGVDIVKNWYDKTFGTKFEGTSPPELYHKYVGHDNNRDWYAFTQVETRMTVDKIHNVFHPQIVHDIHQQGQNAARFFIPPYEPPVEPNVPKQIIEGYTELGSWVAEQMREKGFEGITTNTTYDAWTPARAYSHYHGGARILSETASANLATPTEVKFDDLRGRRGFDAKEKSENFGPVWKGGKWTLRDITNYMTSGAFHVMKHAAENREAWLSRFYEIGKEATRPRVNGELVAFVLPNPDKEGEGPSDKLFNRMDLVSILKRGGVEVTLTDDLKVGPKAYGKSTVVVEMAQPYGGFAKAMLERQTYPDLLDEDGKPIPPYDVTAHNLALLMGVDVEPANDLVSYTPVNRGASRQCKNPSEADIPTYGIYRSHQPSMDEGWTRWVFEQRNKDRCDLTYSSVSNAEILESLKTRTSVVFPDQSPNSILNGYEKDSMLEEYVGGIGEEGVAKLKRFVEDGGTLVFLNRSSEFAIEQFKLPVKDVVDGAEQKDFYIPGSILRVELDTSHPVANGMTKESIAWFERSPAFEVLDDSKVKVIARYPSDSSNVLLSGWALGAEKIAGKAAAVEIPMGKGHIILFGFRPQYRGQSYATFPLLFNAIRR
ncbi:MAG TPA: M14 family zinc carboxypeptidase [Aridibacter sp.]|nr:M14 family zinc carboxypeptidase [Aridibacter sp.]